MSRALISVTNKEGLSKFRRLQIAGWEFISTGGTAKQLKDFDIPVIPIEQVTGVPEMMDGRIKTINHKIAGGVLYIRDNAKHVEAANNYGMTSIDLVVVNFYDFLGNQGIEQIDIGGPSLLLAAVKNARSVVPIVDPNDYDEVIDRLLSHGFLTEGLTVRLASKVMQTTSKLDAQIDLWLRETHAVGKSIFGLPLT